jgi:hypothetical protein
MQCGWLIMKSKRPVIRRMASDVGELSAVVQSFIRPSTNYTGGPGCGIVSDSATSFGQPFNELEGGVFATTWDGNGVKICMSSFIFTLQAESLLQGTGTEHGYPTSKDYLLWWCHSADTASIKANTPNPGACRLIARLRLLTNPRGSTSRCILFDQM